MQEVRHDGIKVSYIMPGSVNTQFGGDEPNESKSWQLQPEDIARVVIDLLHHDERALPSRDRDPAQPAAEKVGLCRGTLRMARHRKITQVSVVSRQSVN